MVGYGIWDMGYGIWSEEVISRVKENGGEITSVKGLGMSYS